MIGLTVFGMGPLICLVMTVKMQPHAGHETVNLETAMPKYLS